MVYYAIAAVKVAYQFAAITAIKAATQLCSQISGTYNNNLNHGVKIRT